MIKTFVYGVPCGFDFYEKDAGFNDYFKGFYIASRRGRRLMVNRRDNGETVYSYLRYGMKEVEREPLHSFFGMSIVIDNYRFCPNFKVLLEWFDYLFDKLVNEHKIIQKDSDGVYRYLIHKFEEGASDVEWLKSNLPNILTQSGQAELLSYDSSFSAGKTGQVVSFSRPVGENRLLATFKKYRWISLLSDITIGHDRNVNNDTAVAEEIIELNFGELNEKLNDFNQQLLPIAVDVSKGSPEDLRRMNDDVQEIIDSIGKYLPSIADKDELEQFNGLGAKYVSLKKSIGTLFGKMSHIPNVLHQETRFCYSCKRNKPLSEFSSATATRCIECEGNSTIKTCIRCGKRKPISAFKQGSDVCNTCEGDKNYEFSPSRNRQFGGIGNYFTNKSVIGVLSLFIVIVIIICCIPKGCSDDNVAVNDSNTSETVSTDDNNMVDQQKLYELIEKDDFQGVYEYIKDKKDAYSYKGHIKSAVEQYLWKIIDTPNGKEDNIALFFIKNKDLLDYIAFNENDKNRWTKFEDDYRTLLAILKKEKITDEDYQKGLDILRMYSGLLNEEWKTRLEQQKRVASESIETELEIGTTFKLTYTKASDGKQTTETVKAVKGVEGLLGTTVTVKCLDGVIEKNKKRKYSFKLEKEMAYQIICHGKTNTVITVHAKPKPITRFSE